MTILDEIAEKTKERVAEAKRSCPDPLQEAASLPPALRRCDIPGGVNTAGPFPFERALQKPGLSVIAEVKKASPSKGLIAPDFPYVDIARSYDAAGADAISCLTEPHWFLGANEYLTEIRRQTDIPILRKDFTVDAYMIEEAKAIGADAVLLIVSILDSVQLKDYLQTATALGLSAVVEAHSAAEIGTALDAGASIVGVNNRNLKDFTVDVSNAGRLRDLVPPDVVFISESGVKTRADVETAEAMKADAILVGESLMRAENKGKKLAELTGRKPRVKICGLTTEADVSLVNELRPAYTGFVFAEKSRRHVTAARAAALSQRLSPEITPVGVFADSPVEEIISLLKNRVIRIAQLHGNESNAAVAAIRAATGRPVIKAIEVRTPADIVKADEYPDADYFLFDAGKGSGTTFGWEVLKDYHGSQPFFLAGGLSPENVQEAVATAAPFAVDVSSGVEGSGPGKDAGLAQAFMEAVKNSG